ncbi:hypothetical protein [Flavobacterium sp. UBA6135]|uniref:hypothetical protein n=1 Tax=Flavobacterium sp. UBA6135 TaxID=1946553 RepID=UPI0025BD4329|nr:hypothetical protein [Flavobacterium sp. UBA6135]
MKKVHFYFLGILFLISLSSCGPKRLGCGPGRCHIENPTIEKQKNPETIISGFLCNYTVLV